MQRSDSQSSTGFGSQARRVPQALLLPASPPPVANRWQESFGERSPEGPAWSGSSSLATDLAAKAEVWLQHRGQERLWGRRARERRAELPSAPFSPSAEKGLQASSLARGPLGLAQTPAGRPGLTPSPQMLGLGAQVPQAPVTSLQPGTPGQTTGRGRSDPGLSSVRRRV